MYTNKCTKCGKEFETKNPKRVICPSCLYPDKTPILSDPNAPSTQAVPQQQYRSYSAGSDNYYKKPYNRDNNRPQRPGGFQKRPQRPGGFQRPGARPGGQRRPMQKPKPLLVNKEQLAQIEEMYKKMLPLPNPDAHEVIGEAIGLEPKKV